MKVISLNIEGDKHLAQVSSFIKTESPDVVCLQEVFQEDFVQFCKKWGMEGKFMPTLNVDESGRPGFGKRGVFGVAIFGRGNGTFGGKYYFKRRGNRLPYYHGHPNAGNRALVWYALTGGSQKLMVATTHFTWSKKGQATGKQRREARSLINIVDNIKPDVLCGDFNAPRGGEIFDCISKRLVDRIPQDTITTLDPELHYAGKLDLVVDGFFTQPRLSVEKVNLIGGISDHCAVVGIINL